MATGTPVKKTPFILALDAYNSKAKGGIPIFYCWNIISIQPLNFLHIFKKILGGGFRATLFFSKILSCEKIGWASRNIVFKYITLCQLCSSLWTSHRLSFSSLADQISCGIQRTNKQDLRSRFLQYFKFSWRSRRLKKKGA